MMNSRSFLAGAAAALLTSQVAAVDQVVNPTLDQNLRLAPTTISRYGVLGNSTGAWVYDFKTNPNYNYWPGGVSNANAATFPASSGYGMTMATLNLGPCSMLPPHYHPRATNFVVAINGSTTTYMLNENGAPIVKTVLTAGKMTIFPQASVHMMYNNGKPVSSELL